MKEEEDLQRVIRSVVASEFWSICQSDKKEEGFMKKVLALLMSIFLIIFSAGCGGTDTAKKNDADGKKVVGVLMPNKVVKRWIKDGADIKRQLEEKGYAVDLRYAENEPPTQIKQIDEMIKNGVSCLVITPIDSTKLVDVLDKAKKNNIPVISYDRLLMDTNAVSYYATFDNKGVGVLIGRYVEDKLGLKNGKGPYNIEFFAGSRDDNNANFLNTGLFEVLQPYIDNKQLIVPSEQTDLDLISILRWSQEAAENRMEDILTNYYADGKKLDVVIAPSDTISYGIENILEKHGYKVGENWPIITGQDAEIEGLKNILSGKQTMTVFKDTRVLASKCVTMVEAVLDGKEPEINDSVSYDNRKFVVPSYLCTPVVVDKSNLKKELIDSGFYTEDDLKTK